LAASRRRFRFARPFSAAAAALSIAARCLAAVSRLAARFLFCRAHLESWATVGSAVCALFAAFSSASPFLLAAHSALRFLVLEGASGSAESTAFVAGGWAALWSSVGGARRSCPLAAVPSRFLEARQRLFFPTAVVALAASRCSRSFFATL
jgi:hypothetical protein